VPGGAPRTQSIIVKREDAKVREWPIPRSVRQEFVAVAKRHDKDSLIKEILQDIEGTYSIHDEDAEEECRSLWIDEYYTI